MTMPQAMGNFVPKPAQTGDRFQANAAVGRPLIVQVVGVDGARQVAGQNGQPAAVKKAVTVHVWDLLGGPVAMDSDTGQVVMGPQNTVYANVMWMAAAVADNLEPFNGAPPMPLKLNKVKGKSNFFYITPVALEGPELQQVQAFFAQDPTRIDREVTAKAQAAAAQSAAPAYQQTGFTPMQVQPSAQGQPANAFQHTNGQIAAPAQPPQYNPAAGGHQFTQQQMPAPAAAQQFQPPPGQQGAIANIPAQVAQQWAPVDQAVQQAMAQQPPQGAFVQAAAPEVAQMPNPVQQAFQQHQAQQFAPQQGQPQFQQPPAAAPGQPGFVQNSDVANILQNLAGGQPQQ